MFGLKIPRRFFGAFRCRLEARHKVRHDLQHQQCRHQRAGHASLIRKQRLPVCFVAAQHAECCEDYKHREQPERRDVLKARAQMHAAMVDDRDDRCQQQAGGQMRQVDRIAGDAI